VTRQEQDERATNDRTRRVELQMSKGNGELRDEGVGFIGGHRAPTREIHVGQPYRRPAIDLG
jgi:hypothetical protein